MIYARSHREAKLEMSAMVAELRESSRAGRDALNLVECVNEGNVEGNTHKPQAGQSVHKEQKSLTQSSGCCFKPW